MHTGPWIQTSLIAREFVEKSLERGTATEEKTVHDHVFPVAEPGSLQKLGWRTGLTTYRPLLPNDNTTRVFHTECKSRCAVNQDGSPVNWYGEIGRRKFIFDAVKGKKQPHAPCSVPPLPMAAGLPCTA